MLFIKAYGVRQISIGTGEFLVRCPSCETHSWADIMAISKYMHVYFVPMWPVAKEANVICRRCGLKRYGIVFGPQLINNFEEVKSGYRHPWFSYTGLILIILFVLILILTQR